MEELGSLSSWEAHCNVSGRSFPQDVWNRWFNHVKFLVLPTWLNTCPLFLQQQQVPFTILRNNMRPTQGCSQGSALVFRHRAPFGFTRPQSPPTPQQVLTFPWHTEPVPPSLAILHLSLGKIPPQQDKTNTAHRRGTCQTVMFCCGEQFTAPGGSSWQAGLTTPSRGSSRNLPPLLGGNITGLLNCATRQMGCVWVMRLTRHREISPIFLKILGHLLLWSRVTLSHLSDHC